MRPRKCLLPRTDASPAPTGRPALYCSLTCRRDNEYAVARRRWEERERRERPKREAERKAQREAQEAARLEAEEAERQRNLAAGGLVALHQMQRDAFENERRWTWPPPATRRHASTGARRIRLCSKPS